MSGRGKGNKGISKSRKATPVKQWNATCVLCRDTGPSTELEGSHLMWSGPSDEEALVLCSCCLDNNMFTENEHLLQELYDYVGKHHLDALFVTTSAEDPWNRCVACNDAISPAHVVANEWYEICKVCEDEGSEEVFPAEIISSRYVPTFHMEIADAEQLLDHMAAKAADEADQSQAALDDKSRKRKRDQEA